LTCEHSGVRLSWLVLGVISASLLAACSTRSSDGPAAQGPPHAAVVQNRQGASPPSAAQVTARLLTLKDLPTNWTAQPVTGPQPSDTGLCNAGHPSATTERIEVFNGPAPNTEIAENLYGLGSKAAAQAAYRYQTSHATCATYRPPNTPLTISRLRPIALPEAGRSSMAWQATVSNAQTGVTQHADLLLIDDASYNVALIDRTTGKVDTALFESTARKTLGMLNR
jgi:hypothetical protein